MTYNKKAKIKVLYLLKMLQEETDAEHGLTMTQIIQKLAEQGVSAERKSIYDDIKALREFDIDIKTYQRNPVQYAIERKDFTLEELMLLVDAVQSCKSITDRQAKALVTNIKQLANNREQALLDRRIHVEGRIKSKTESVLSTVDLIHEALRQHCKMEFGYQRLGVDGKFYEPRKGYKHHVTPVAVAYDDGFYYLVAWDEAHENMVDYRLDRMLRPRLLAEEPATKNEIISTYRYEEGKAMMFGRFGGQKVHATLAAVPGKVEIITDRFGSYAKFIEEAEDGSAQAQVLICVSEQFYGWIASMGKAVRIVGPQSLLDGYREYLKNLLED